MGRTVLFFFMLVISGCTNAVVMKDEADAAREKSDSILREFKTIEKDLQKSNQRIDSLKDELNKSLQNK